MLSDGTYDALVVDAEPEVAEESSPADVAGAEAPPVVRLDLTILAGEHKGEMVAVRASGLSGDPIELLGIPATLVVRDGQPEVRLEP